jgi:hypothetical protein
VSKRGGAGRSVAKSKRPPYRWVDDWRKCRNRDQRSQENKRFLEILWSRHLHLVLVQVYGPRLTFGFTSRRSRRSSMRRSTTDARKNPTLSGSWTLDTLTAAIVCQQTLMHIVQPLDRAGTDRRGWDVDGQDCPPAWNWRAHDHGSMIILTVGLLPIRENQEVSRLPKAQRRVIT